MSKKAKTIGKVKHMQLPSILHQINLQSFCIRTQWSFAETMKVLCQLYWVPAQPAPRAAQGHSQIDIWGVLDFGVVSN